jgi:hypothetical protein
MREFKLPYEVVEGIALASLQDHLEMLKTEVRNHLQRGDYLHPEDFENSVFKLIPSFEVLIRYYGGTLK